MTTNKQTKFFTFKTHFFFFFVFFFSMQSSEQSYSHGLACDFTICKGTTWWHNMQHEGQQGRERTSWQRTRAERVSKHIVEHASFWNPKWCGGMHAHSHTHTLTPTHGREGGLRHGRAQRPIRGRQAGKQGVLFIQCASMWHQSISLSIYVSLSVCMHVCIFIFIYMYVYIWVLFFLGLGWVMEAEAPSVLCCPLTCPGKGEGVGVNRGMSHCCTALLCSALLCSLCPALPSISFSTYSSLCGI